MTIEEIVNEEFYVWVAPDGVIQLNTISPDEITCIAYTKLCCAYGMGQSPAELMAQGYELKKVTLTIKSA